MKILSLIGTLIAAAGTALQLMVFLSFFNGDVTYQELFEYSSFNNFGVPAIAQIVLFLGMLLVYISGFIKTNKMLIISGILSILSIFMIMLGWLLNNGNIYGGLYTIGSFLFVLATLLYFIGCILFRKKNPVTIFSSLLLFLIVAAVGIYFGFISIMILGLTNESVNMHLNSILVQSVVFVLHGLVFSFSKKTDKFMGIDKDDTSYSIDSGTSGAFASYVPYDGGTSSSNKKKKKKKKKGSSDDFDFNF